MRVPRPTHHITHVRGTFARCVELHGPAASKPTAAAMTGTMLGDRWETAA